MKLESFRSACINNSKWKIFKIHLQLKTNVTLLCTNFNAITSFLDTGNIYTRYFELSETTHASDSK